MAVNMDTKAREFVVEEARKIMTAALGSGIVGKNGLYQRTALYGLQRAGLITAIVGRNAYTVTLTDAGRDYAAKSANRRAGAAALAAKQAEIDADQHLMDSMVQQSERAEHVRAYEGKMKRDAALEAVPALPATGIELGTYTVVLPTGGHFTVHVVEGFKNAPGSMIFGYMNGPDNERSFENVGTIYPNGTIRIWGRCIADSSAAAAATAVNALQSGGKDALRAAGYEYALRSSKCCKCGHKLTVPASIHQGMGPDCAKKYA